MSILAFGLAQLTILYGRGVWAFLIFNLSERKRRIRIAFINANLRVEEAVMGDARVALVDGGGFI